MTTIGYSGVLKWSTLWISSPMLSLAGYVPESGATRAEPWGARCRRALMLAILSLARLARLPPSLKGGLCMDPAHLVHAPAAAGHIFLSYRSLERPFAVKLAVGLQNAGVAVWLDRFPTGIKPGDDWPQTL